MSEKTRCVHVQCICWSFLLKDQPNSVRGGGVALCKSPVRGEDVGIGVGV